MTDKALFNIGRGRCFFKHNGNNIKIFTLVTPICLNHAHFNTTNTVVVNERPVIIDKLL